MTEGKMANRASNYKSRPVPLTSRSGSATVYCMYMQVTEFFSTHKSMDQLCDLSVGKNLQKNEYITGFVLEGGFTLDEYRF